ncbi:MAG: hypothetical protein EON58_07555 [Alphaproteobacteria bacterium]|nr:MAG: hypothetical protein EON58_07555 [Alphaproteobacteria bacterium]
MSTSSAMNPALLLCLIVCPLAFTLGGSLFHFNHPIAATLMTCIGIYPLLITGWQVVYFTTRQPDRLQREQHIENMTQIRSRLGIKEDGKIIEVPVSQKLTGNPHGEGVSGE